MGIRPQVKVIANGANISDAINRRLIRLDLVDEAGESSDSLTILLAQDGSLALPPKGGELQTWLGYDGSLTRMGVYIVDELKVRWNAGVSELEIKAKASPQAAETPSGYMPLQTQRTRSWDAGTTLGGMARTIAGEHGLQAVVAEELDGVVLDHIDQVNESDINLLTRLARERDAVAKPAGGRLVLVLRGGGVTATGEEIPPVIRQPHQVTLAEATISGRYTSGSVVAVWRDADAAVDREVTVGEGEPVTRLRHTYQTEEQAGAAASAELSRGQRGERQLTVTMPGDPDIIAEGTLVMLDFGVGIDGMWSITKANHRISRQGYVVVVTCELPGGSDDSSRRRAGGGGDNSGQLAREYVAENFPWLYETVTQPDDPLRRDVRARDAVNEILPSLPWLLEPDGRD